MSKSNLIKDLVKDNTAQFVRIEFDEQCEEYWKLQEAGDNFKFVQFFDSAIYGENHYIPLETNKGRIIYKIVENDYEFPISFSEMKGGRFENTHRAINLMRWVRKSLGK